jgi:hypothetical protein
VTLVDLKDFPMPVYDGDLEAASGIRSRASGSRSSSSSTTA